MSKYVFVYHGGTVPETEAEQRQIMAAWDDWFHSLGDAVIDGGNPVGPSTTITSDGATVHGGGPNPTSGYSLIDADDLNTALEIGKACPILASGGSIEVALAINMQ